MIKKILTDNPVQTTWQPLLNIVDDIEAIFEYLNIKNKRAIKAYKRCCCIKGVIADICEYYQGVYPDGQTHNVPDIEAMYFEELNGGKSNTET